MADLNDSVNALRSYNDLKIDEKVADKTAEMIDAIDTASIIRSERFQHLFEISLANSVANRFAGTNIQRNNS